MATSCRPSPHSGMWLTQQRHWGVGVSCDFPVIIVVAVVISPLLLLLLLLLVVVVSPPFLLVVSPPSSLFPSFGSFPSSFPSHFPSSSCLLLLIVSPSCSPSFSSFMSFPPTSTFSPFSSFSLLIVVSWIANMNHDKCRGSCFVTPPGPPT